MPAHASSGLGLLAHGGTPDVTRTRDVLAAEPADHLSSTGLPSIRAECGCSREHHQPKGERREVTPHEDTRGRKLHGAGGRHPCRPGHERARSSADPADAAGRGDRRVVAAAHRRRPRGAAGPQRHRRAAARPPDRPVPDRQGRARPRTAGQYRGAGQDRRARQDAHHLHGVRTGWHQRPDHGRTDGRGAQRHVRGSQG